MMNCHLQSGQWNSSDVKTKCSICSDDHIIYKCPRFLALAVEDWWPHSKTMSIRPVCLRQGHRSGELRLIR